MEIIDALSKLRSLCAEASLEEARSGFPFLANYPSSEARKWLAAFRSFAPEDRVTLAPLLVMHQLRHEIPIAQKLKQDEQELLTQMLGRVEHVPIVVLEELAKQPVRRLAEWDGTTSDASHVDVMLRRAKRADVRRSVLKALRENGFAPKSVGGPCYVVTELVGSATVRYLFDFGGQFWQMRLDANVEFGSGKQVRGITLPICLGYLVIGFDEVVPDNLDRAGMVAVQELKMLDRLVRATLA